ncbi:MAG: hypothetical protein J07HQW2_02623 [Haloquadratum walsbyi J07HQW2]|jgi:hypothetical protein|uniref:Uncharacterized protein n=1 Tax=Haloquadratum walsbyi J07HQW2 TaxID=1238425 RepID=U1NH07_9EURY|nr:MAG: hypothetical protein J07HQW2_02623 [Haloquadratum walsbyi J07HQW2]
MMSLAIIKQMNITEEMTQLEAKVIVDASLIQTFTRKQ